MGEEHVGFFFSFSRGTLTQVAVDDLAVVHLASHGADLLQLGLLALHALLQPLQLLALRDGLLLAPLLLLQVAQALLLHGAGASVHD